MNDDSKRRLHDLFISRKQFREIPTEGTPVKRVAPSQPETPYTGLLAKLYAKQPTLRAELVQLEEELAAASGSEVTAFTVDRRILRRPTRETAWWIAGGVRAEVEVGEMRSPLTLLNGLEATFVRRVTQDAFGRRNKAFFIEAPGRVAERVDDLPLGLIPLLDPGPALSDSDFAILTEGAQAGQALQALQKPAFATLTSPLVTPARESLAPLLGYQTVFLWPDNDALGARHMAKIGLRLREMNPRLTLKTIYWRDGGPSADAADFPGDAAALDALLAAADEFDPDALENFAAEVPAKLAIPQAQPSSALDDDLTPPSQLTRIGTTQ